MNRILLLHPEDNMPRHTTRADYDLIVDLGYAPASTYADWTRESGCPAVSLSDFRDPEVDLRHLRELMRFGMGQVQDEIGLDWWDLMSLRFYERMLDVLALQRFFGTCEPNAEISISRTGFHACGAQTLSGGNLKILKVQSSFKERIALRASRLTRLRPRQVLEIIGDKYDGNYRLRRHFVRRQSASTNPFVLLPSAYGTASRTALAYASALPDAKFLLVRTRQGGWIKNPPSNVTCARLAAFAPGKCDARELQNLLSSWQTLLNAFREHRELSVLASAGCFDAVPRILREGLCIRDAWINVFARNQISAVLCADEMNWYTRIPLLIARARGIPAIACHHGALDFRYSFRETSANRLLVKGHMELQYLLSRGVPEHQMEIAAPPRPQPFRRESCPRDAIIFFSEPYEVFGGRAQGFYREVLPPLAELADRHGKKLVLKLHPYESVRERRHLAEAVLSPAQTKLLEIFDAPLENELLNRAWFGVTINSTTAVDCALCQVPVFLCRWLDATYSGYSDQFVKFGAAKKLSSIEEIFHIPQVLETLTAPTLAAFSEPIEPDRLIELLSAKGPVHVEKFQSIGA